MKDGTARGGLPGGSPAESGPQNKSPTRVDPQDREPTRDDLRHGGSPVDGSAAGGGAQKNHHKSGLIERAQGEWRIVTTLSFILVAFGVYAFMTMPRQEFPDFTVRQGLVIAVMPGASAQQIEEQVARPVEDYVFGFKEINKKKTYSVSKDGQVIVFVELNENVRFDQAKIFWATLRHGLNELKSQKLPPGVLALIGNNDFGDTSALLFTVEAEGRSPRDMEKYLDVLEAHLRQLPATSKLNRVGTQQEVIRVSLSYKKLARYGARAANVWSSLQALGNLPVPARLDSDALELPIHVQDVLRSERELEETIILAGPTGQLVRLKDIATVHREYGHDDSFIRHNGKTAVVLSVEMQLGFDITEYGKQVEQAIAASVRELPPEVKIRRIADQPRVVRDSIGHFLRDFGIAIMAVILVTMLLLPIRVAGVAAITIPICIFVTIGLLDLFGLELQIVSLAGLILVLGMVVDNAIIVVDDHVERLDHGETPWNAAWKAARSLSVAVITATLAIVMAYLPLPVFMTGMGGEFLGSLPVTVATALVVSMLLAAFLVPFMASGLIHRGLRAGRGAGRRSLLDWIQSGFDVALETAFRHRWLTLLVGGGSVVAAVAIAVGIPQQIFPKVDRNQFAVEVYLPNGRTLDQTDELVKRIERDLLGDKRVTDVTAFVGSSSPRFHTVYAPNMPARSYAQLVVNTTSDQTTVDVLRKFQKSYAGEVAGAWVRWKQLELAPTRAPIEIRLTGSDQDSVRNAAVRIKDAARTIPGATWVRDDSEETLRSVEVLPDADMCARLGLSPAMLRTSVALGTQGFPVATLWEGDYPIRVLIEDEDTGRNSLERLLGQQVSSLWAGASIPLEQVATLKPAWNEGAIIRRNGVRTLTVSVDVGMDVLASVVQAELDRRIAALGATPGVTIEYGGDKDFAAESYGNLTKALLTSIACIYLILLIQFRRHRLALLVMATMPLSLLGAILGLVVTGYPFGLTAFVGVISLMGIVVRNGIILVDYAERLRKRGMGARSAALAAGKRRMRPIYLTTMAAAVGVIPMILSGSTLWGPLAAVTCFGLLLSMVLTLFVLPTAYSLVIREPVNSTPPRGDSAAVSVAAGVLAVLAVLMAPSEARAAEEAYTLEQAIALARKNAAEPQQARLEVQAAQETKSEMYTKYFPQISASGALLVAKDPLLQMETSGGNLPVYDGNPANLQTATEFAYMPSGVMGMETSLSLLMLTAVQPVFAGGRLSNANALAEVGVEAATTMVSVRERDAVAQTEEKYWRLVVLKEKQRTVAAFEALLENLKKQVDDGYQAGLLTRNDQLKVALKQSQARVDRIQLENGIKLASWDFRRHLGIPEGDTIELLGTLGAPQNPAALNAMGREANAHRPELQLLEQSVRAEELKVKLKKGEMLPTLSVGASVYRVHAKGFPADTNVVAFGVLNVPITGIFEARHAAASQEKRAEVAQLKLAETRKLIELDVNKSWNELWAAWEMASVSTLTAEQADTNLKEVSDQYQNGMVPFSDVLEAQLLQQSAKDKDIDMRSDYWLKRSAYLRAVGRGK